MKIGKIMNMAFILFGTTFLLHVATAAAASAIATNQKDLNVDVPLGTCDDTVLYPCHPDLVRNFDDIHEVDEFIDSIRHEIINGGQSQALPNGDLLLGLDLDHPNETQLQLFDAIRKIARKEVKKTIQKL